jgi:hypothetical protein
MQFPDPLFSNIGVEGAVDQLPDELHVLRLTGRRPVEPGCYLIFQDFMADVVKVETPVLRYPSCQGIEIAPVELAELLAYIEIHGVNRVVVPF